MKKIYSIDDLRKNPDKIIWSLVNLKTLPLDIVREFKDRIDFTVVKIEYEDKFNFYTFLRCNHYVDFDFIREMVNEFKDKIDLREVMCITDYKFGGKHQLELLRMWVDWNVENKTEGLY